MLIVNFESIMPRFNFFSGLFETSFRRCDALVSGFLHLRVRGELVIHEQNQLLSLVTELPLHYPLRL
jgi:hypothetical protein